MDRKEERVDMRDPAYMAFIDEMRRSSGFCFDLNHTRPMTEEYREILDELFEGRIPKTSMITAPMQIDMAKLVTVGNHVFINHSLTIMARGGVIIEDGVMIGPGAYLLTANHDLIDHSVLLCSPIHIKEHAWIGADAKILAGVTVGAHAVVAAGAIVTKDVPEWTIVGGCPAKVIKQIEH